MSEFALVKGDVIDNIIVVDDGGEFDPHAYVADDGNAYDRAVDCSTLAEQPAIGWVLVAGRGYVPPTELTVDPIEIPPDGVTGALATYVDHRSDPPPEVDFVVNGETHTAPMSAGVATLPIASSTPGDVINVTVEGMTAGITVAGP